MSITVMVADICHMQYAERICKMILSAAKIRGTGISKRNPAYIKDKIEQGNAVIAFDDNELVGFCYIESWENEKYIANSGLIVHPDYRKSGLAKLIKSQIFGLSKEKYPHSQLFGITTSPAVLKINSQLGYKPVAFVELTNDKKFWDGCQSCPNYDILQRTDRKMCLCTAMVCDLSDLPLKQIDKNKIEFNHEE